MKNTFYSQGNPYKIVRTTSATYTASVGELIIADETEITLPSGVPAGSVIAVRSSNDTVTTDVVGASGSIDGFSAGTTHQEAKTGEYVYDGSDWYLRNSVDIRDGAIPDSEGFEHNDLTGNYGGDTGSFSILSSTVYEGSYGVQGDGGGSVGAIGRDEGQDKWGPDIRITYRQYLPSGDADFQGLVFGAQSVSGYSSLSGYFAEAGESNDTVRLSRIDSGERRILNDVSRTVPSDNWFLCSVDWYSDGLIDFTVDGSTVSATDSTYSDGYMGFFAYRETFIDNVQFELI